MNDESLNPTLPLKSENSKLINLTLTPETESRETAPLTKKKKYNAKQLVG